MRGHEKWADIFAEIEYDITLVTHQASAPDEWRGRQSQVNRSDDGDELDAWLRQSARLVGNTITPPTEFTARVMQRVNMSAQASTAESGVPSAYAKLRPSATAIASVVVVSILLVLIPSFVIAVQEPALALSILSWFVQSLLALVTTLAFVAEVLAAFVFNDIAMITLLGAVALIAILGSRVLFPALRTLHEA